MARFETLTGDLYVGESAEGVDHIDADAQTHLYTAAVFRTNVIDIAFNSLGYFPVQEQDFTEQHNETVYYPYYNETSARVQALKGNESLTLYNSDVTLKYAACDAGVFIRSQNDVTAYGGAFTVNDNLYRLNQPMLFKSEGESDPDDFLDIPAVENPVRVTNIETGVSSFVPADRVRNVVEREEPNGLLELREPENLTHQVLAHL